MYEETRLGVYVRANTGTRTQNLYNLGYRIFISTSGFKGRFAAHMNDTAFCCALGEQLTMTYQVMRLCNVTRMVCS